MTSRADIAAGRGHTRSHTQAVETEVPRSPTQRRPRLSWWIPCLSLCTVFWFAIAAMFAGLFGWAYMSVECDFKDMTLVPYDATVHDCTHYATVLHESVWKTNTAHDGRTTVQACDVKVQADIRDENREINLCSTQSERRFLNTYTYDGVTWVNGIILNSNGYVNGVRVYPPPSPPALPPPPPGDYYGD